MRPILIALGLSLTASAAWAQKPEAPVCKPRFEGTYTNGTRAEADAQNEAEARRLFEAHAAKENQKRKAAKPGAAAEPKKEMVDLALDRVRRLADNCTGLQGFLVF